MDTGLYWTTISPYSSILVTAFRLAAATSLYPRDPLTITIEGSNVTYTNLHLGSSWHLIYTGSSGLGNATTPGTWGALKQVTNTNRYCSFRVLATSKRGSDVAVQFFEIQLHGHF